MWKDFHQNTQYWKQICYRTRKYTFQCRHMCALFGGGPEILQVGAVKGLRFIVDLVKSSVFSLVGEIQHYRNDCCCCCYCYYYYASLLESKIKNKSVSLQVLLTNQKKTSEIIKYCVLKCLIYFILKLEAEFMIQYNLHDSGCAKQHQMF